jgi:CHAD domain-containing protein
MAEGKWISDLTPSTAVVDAAARVLGARLKVVQHYLEPALREPEKDAEHVHQLRVGTRRAGTALRIFAPYLPRRVCKRVKRQMRQLRQAAGVARDWDVFLITLAQRMHRAKHPAPGADFLLGYALGQRQAAQAQLDAAGAELTGGFERFRERSVAAVRQPSSQGAPRTLLDLARPMLAGLLAELDEAAAQDLTDYGTLHQVRIIGKRLRYAMEVFVSCFPPPFRETLYPAVEEMQEILGRANDSRVASGRLAALRDQLRTAHPAHWKRLRPEIDGLLRFHQRRLSRERQHFRTWWDWWRHSEARPTFAAFLEMAQTGGV